MDETPAACLAAAKEKQPFLTKHFRYLHRHPETAHKEQGTNRYLRAVLEDMSIPYLAPQDNITIAVLDSGKPGPCVGLRCDTDALPVQEETGLDYASENPGVMHACGHDAHIAAGLGALSLLSERKEDWRGRVKLIFQPAEEGEDGSDEVIATHLVDDVDAFFALHVWSPFADGTLHISPITVSAAVDMFEIRIHGKGGHGATPQLCADAVVAGSALVCALQSVVSRSVPPTSCAVLTVGSFHAGEVGNVIAGEAVLKGTLRCLDEETRLILETRLRELSETTAAAYGCTVEVNNIRVSDAVQNDPALTACARRCAEGLVPQDRLGEQKTMMLGDNFANYGAIAPYCYGQVGIADRNKETDHPHHNGKFRVDEEVLPLCSAWMAAFVSAYGRNENGKEI